MLNTYLNDNQRRPYPFYGGEALPFPMSCITGLGICIQDDGSLRRVYVSAIAISRNSVRVAVCRESDGVPEFLGILYADTTGWYTYTDSATARAVYETYTIPEPVDPSRLVYYDDDYEQAQQVFYSYVLSLSLAEREYARSTAYMQLGTIPEDAVGVYTGKFYLDPGCVTYISADVIGRCAKMIVNKTESETPHSLEIVTGGLLTASVTGGTLSFGTLEAADSNVLTETPAVPYSFITSINGYMPKATEEQPYPVLKLDDYPDQTVPEPPPAKIRWSVRVLGTGDVLLTVNGTKVFPNCYGAQDDAES